jgi:hypothetical protein
MVEASPPSLRAQTLFLRLSRWEAAGTLKKLYTILLLALLVVATLTKVSTANLQAKSNSNEKEVGIPKEKEDGLDRWIESLVKAESSGQEDIEIIDANGRWSRGCLQFQDETIRSYSALLGYFVGTSTEDIRSVALSCEASKRLARSMLLDDYKNWRNWYTSSKKIGLPPRVEPRAEGSTERKANSCLSRKAI